MHDVKHILQITAKAPSWGFDLFREISIALTDNGQQVTTVFINSAKDSPSGQVYDGDVVMLGLNNKNIFWRLIAILRLVKILTAKKYDSIICHHYKPSSLLAFIDRLIPQQRLFMINHNPNNLRRKGRTWVVRYLFSNRWSYVGVSEWVKRDFLEKAFFVNPERMHVLYNCIDIEAIQANQLGRSEARKKLGIPEDAFVFGNIHRLDKSKGHDYMIRAFAQSAKDMPSAVAVIIGGGDRKNLLEAIANECGVADRVFLTGVIHNASWYTKAFDVYVAPSLHEGFGLGLLEGMAASLPILTSTGGATPEVAGDAGLSFPPGDSDTLAAHMKTIYLMNESERMQIGQSSLQRLQENFSRETYHNNVAQLFAP